MIIRNVLTPVCGARHFASCLQEEDVKMMARCVQLDIECAAVCYSAAQLMSLGSSRAEEFCRTCAEVCQECARECGEHKNDHCRECAEACRACAEECMHMAAV